MPQHDAMDPDKTRRQIEAWYQQETAASRRRLIWRLAGYAALLVLIIAGWLLLNGL